MLFVPWVVVALHSDQAGYGALLSTQAIGGLAGAIVIGRYANRINPLFLLIAGALLFGVIDLGLFTYPAVFPYIWPALIVMVIVGVPGAAMQASWVTQGLGIAQVSLEYGVNDFGGTMMEENVVSATGLGACPELGKIVGTIRDAGYTLHSPEGAFYLLPKSPWPDDWAFMRFLGEQDVYVLPGTVLEMPGYFRISVTASRLSRKHRPNAAAAIRAGRYCPDSCLGRHPTPVVWGGSN